MCGLYDILTHNSPEVEVPASRGSDKPVGWSARVHFANEANLLIYYIRCTVFKDA